MVHLSLEHAEVQQRSRHGLDVPRCDGDVRWPRGRKGGHHALDLEGAIVGRAGKGHGDLGADPQVVRHRAPACARNQEVDLAAVGAARACRTSDHGPSRSVGRAEHDHDRTFDEGGQFSINHSSPPPEIRQP
ncbi:hypothetical protein D3C72_605890 [compost metagenome]